MPICWCLGESPGCFLPFQSPFPTQTRLGRILMLSRDRQHKDILQGLNINAGRSQGFRVLGHCLSHFCFSLGCRQWLLPCLFVTTKKPQIPPTRLLGCAESKQQISVYSQILIFSVSLILLKALLEAEGLKESSGFRNYGWNKQDRRKQKCTLEVKSPARLKSPCPDPTVWPGLCCWVWRIPGAERRILEHIFYKNWTR